MAGRLCGWTRTLIWTSGNFVARRLVGTGPFNEEDRILSSAHLSKLYAIGWSPGFTPVFRSSVLSFHQRPPCSHPTFVKATQKKSPIYCPPCGFLSCGLLQSSPRPLRHPKRPSRISQPFLKILPSTPRTLFQTLGESCYNLGEIQCSNTVTEGEGDLNDNNDGLAGSVGVKIDVRVPTVSLERGVWARDDSF